MASTMRPAAEALPEKYRKRLRRADVLERFIQEIRRREVNAPNLPKRWLGRTACRSSLCRNAQRMVNRSPVPDHGGILRMEN
jgi:hypothetical protein